MLPTPEDVNRIALLARSDLVRRRTGGDTGQLNGFFGIMRRMSAVDTRGIGAGCVHAAVGGAGGGGWWLGDASDRQLRSDPRELTIRVIASRTHSGTWYLE